MKVIAKSRHDRLTPDPAGVSTGNWQP
jgi:hypothetical protein